MKHTHISILCDHDITKKPRSSRILELLEIIKATHTAHNMQLYVISKNCKMHDFARFSKSARLLTFPNDKSSKERSEAENAQILTNCRDGQFERLIFTPNRMAIFAHLRAIAPQDLLIVEDITLLPFAAIYKRQHPKCQILCDLREFYPLEYENDLQWRDTFGRYFQYLCECYLSDVDIALSVSEGLCARYERDFGIKAHLFYSLPPFVSLEPTPTNAKNIKILYHGFISPDRESMSLLSLGESLRNSPYMLYIMALSNQKGFLESFATKAANIHTMKLIKPVKLEQIITKSADFDIGLIPFKPTTFNLTHCMPNKLFEYMQSRLAILSTPLDSIRTFLQTQNIGLITQGFESEDIARRLCVLSVDEINMQKAKSHTLAQKWNLEHNLMILTGLFEERILY